MALYEINCVADAESTIVLIKALPNHLGSYTLQILLYQFHLIPAIHAFI